ncbi:hypothetical protein SRHO_G00202980 [Serrasalmus rhombeus]
MARGYWQVGVEESSRPKTAFGSYCGLFQYKVLPFGLCNTPATFQRVMNAVLVGLIYKCCAFYLNDIVFASPTFKQHLVDLKEVFTRLEEAELTLKLGKSQFCRNKLKFLGYKILPDGILPDTDEVDAILKFPVPADVKHEPTKCGCYIDVLQRYAAVAGLDLESQPLIELSDKEQLRHLQDLVVAEMLQKLEDLQEDKECKDKFVAYDGLLYYQDMGHSCSLHPLSDLKLFVPESSRESRLSYYYDHPTAGHLGFTKTLARLKLQFFWPKMRKDVRSYVLSCPVCQLTKPSQQKPTGMLVPVYVNEPWEVAGVDFVGHLPRPQAGNACLLVFVDYFSKWVEVSAVKEATAQVVAIKFQSDIFARHCAPNLISDRGQQFECIL